MVGIDHSSPKERTGPGGGARTSQIASSPARITPIVRALHPVSGPAHERLDEHSLELYVVTPDGVAVTKRVHAAVLVCVKRTGLFNIVAYTLTIISLLAVVYLVVQVVNWFGINLLG